MSDRRSPIELVTVAQLVEMFASTLGHERSSDEISAALTRLGIYGVTLSSDQANTLLDAMSKLPGMVGITARVTRSRLELGRAQPPSYPETQRAEALTPSRMQHVPPAHNPPSASHMQAPPAWPAQSSSQRATPGAGASARADPTTLRAAVPLPETLPGVPVPSGLLSDDSPTSSRREASTEPSSGGASSGPPSGRTVTPAEIASLLANALSPEGCLQAVRGAIRTLDLPSEQLDKAQAVAVLDLLAKEPGPLGLCARFGKARLILRFAA